jgi:hypothetical protein
VNNIVELIAHAEWETSNWPTTSINYDWNRIKLLDEFFGFDMILTLSIE